LLNGCRPMTGQSLPSTGERRQVATLSDSLNLSSSSMPEASRSVIFAIKYQDLFGRVDFHQQHTPEKMFWSSIVNQIWLHNFSDRARVRRRN
jgi:hypothetical protein